MIEIVYREENENEDEIAVALPKNMRQMGDTKGNKKVYVEELVLEAIKNKDKKRYGILLGTVKHAREISYLFVNAVVFADENIGNSTNNNGSNVEFTSAVWTRMNEEWTDWGKELSVLGWFVHGTEKQFPEPTLRRIHLNHFAGNDRICIRIDDEEETEQIYYYGDSSLVKLNGYYCYTERHSGFTSYLMRNDFFKKEKTLEEKQTEEKAELLRGQFRKMIPSYLLVAFFLAGIVFMNNYGQMKSIKTSLSGIAGEMIQTKTTEKEPLLQVENVTGKPPRETETQDATAQEKEQKIEKQETEKQKTEKQDKKSGEKNETSEKQKAEKQDKKSGEKKQTSEKQDTEKQKKEKQTEAKEVAVAELQPRKELRYYEIQKGETLTSICRRIYGDPGMVSELKLLNDIQDENLIYEGQKIILP